MNKIIKSLISILLICFLSACSSSNNTPQQPITYENEVEVSETITISENTQIYSSPNEEGEVVGEITNGENINVISKIEDKDYDWYKLEDNKWIKVNHQVNSLSSANNWEEMAKIVTNGYWFTEYRDKDSEYINIIAVNKFYTIGLGLDTDKTACCLEGKGVAYLGYTFNNEECVSWGSLEYVSEDVANKRVSMRGSNCTEVGMEIVFDYSNLDQGILTADGKISAMENADDYFSYTFYYYSTLEEALNVFGDGTIGEIEILAKKINIRRWNSATGEPMGSVSQGEKYKIYERYDGTKYGDYYPESTRYIWYVINENPAQYVADDGTWIKYTPYEFEYR